MEKLKTILRFALNNFAPVIVFYGVQHFSGLRMAIIASTIFSVGEIAWRMYRREEITSLFKFSAATTLLFGMVDIYSTQPILMRYESVVTNVITGVFFATSLFARRSVIEEMSAARLNGRPVTRDLAAFFRLFTIAWAGYFFVKAALYFWAARHLTPMQALAFRSSFGPASMYALIFVSAAGGRPIFMKLKEWKLLPAVEAVTQAA